jgi:hypothetical protein
MQTMKTFYIGLCPFSYYAATLLLLAAWTAPAAMLTVTTTADSGAGSLRAALANAASGDTIDATGISGSILLASGELAVDNNVTILGPGPGQPGAERQRRRQGLLHRSRRGRPNLRFHHHQRFGRWRPVFDQRRRHLSRLARKCDPQ